MGKLKCVDVLLDRKLYAALDAIRKKERTSYAKLIEQALCPPYNAKGLRSIPVSPLTVVEARLWAQRKDPGGRRRFSVALRPAATDMLDALAPQGVTVSKTALVTYVVRRLVTTRMVADLFSSGPTSPEVRWDAGGLRSLLRPGACSVQHLADEAGQLGKRSARVAVLRALALKRVDRHLCQVAEHVGMHGEAVPNVECECGVLRFDGGLRHIDAPVEGAGGDRRASRSRLPRDREERKIMRSRCHP